MDIHTERTGRKGRERERERERERLEDGRHGDKRGALGGEPAAGQLGSSPSGSQMPAQNGAWTSSRCCRLSWRGVGGGGEGLLPGLGADQQSQLAFQPEPKTQSWKLGLWRSEREVSGFQKVKEIFQEMTKDNAGECGGGRLWHWLRPLSSSSFPFWPLQWGVGLAAYGPATLKSGDSQNCLVGQRSNVSEGLCSLFGQSPPQAITCANTPSCP